MDTTIVKRKGKRAYNRFGQEIIPCCICSAPTTMIGTKMCDNCYELDSRIRGNYMLASRIFIGISVERQRQAHNPNYNKKYYDPRFNDEDIIPI